MPPISSTTISVSGWSVNQLLDVRGDPDAVQVHAAGLAGVANRGPLPAQAACRPCGQCGRPARSESVRRRFPRCPARSIRWCCSIAFTTKRADPCSPAGQRRTNPGAERRGRIVPVPGSSLPFATWFLPTRFNSQIFATTCRLPRLIRRIPNSYSMIMGTARAGSC